MTWANAAGGIAGVIVALVFTMYLRVRTRQMTLAARQMNEFRQIGSAILMRDIPDEAREVVVDLASLVGTGRITRKLLRSLADGKLDTPTRRAKIQERRTFWADYPRETRVAFTQFVFSSILTDTYYAGFMGTLLRRSLFFIKNNPAEIAEAVDAMETRILIVGTAEIGHDAVDRSRADRGLVRA